MLLLEPLHITDMRDLGMGTATYYGAEDIALPSLPKCDSANPSIRPGVQRCWPWVPAEFTGILLWRAYPLRVQQYVARHHLMSLYMSTHDACCATNSMLHQVKYVHHPPHASHKTHKKKNTRQKTTALVIQYRALFLLLDGLWLSFRHQVIARTILQFESTIEPSQPTHPSTAHSIVFGLGLRLR